MRGNDLLMASQDVLVTDSLTGNVLMKVLSAFTSGGSYETSGAGYGPGVGEKMSGIVMIVSRASGVPVIAGAVAYAASLARGGLKSVYMNELSLARKAGLDRILAERREAAAGKSAAAETIAVLPPRWLQSRLRASTSWTWKTPSTFFGARRFMRKAEWAVPAPLSVCRRLIWSKLRSFSKTAVS